jgi:hypothetical protein
MKCDNAMSGEGGSSPDDDGTGPYCQTTRARLARRKGVREKPVLQGPSSEATSSNLADVGWAAANLTWISSCVGGTPAE